MLIWNILKMNIAQMFKKHYQLKAIVNVCYNCSNYFNILINFDIDIKCVSMTVKVELWYV